MRIATLALGSLLVLAACAGTGEISKPTPPDEIPDGPGLFSGKDGEFVIYRR